jgi:signal transduction histidine kinase
VVVLLLTFWQVLRRPASACTTRTRNFELQYRNNQLIESLTRQTQAALDAVEIKNRFLASAAHDIRQPVHALGLYADWLGSEPELVHELAPKIVESTKAVNQLFDSLFDLARLDSGKIRLNIETVDVAKLLHDLELQYRPLCEAKGLQFRAARAPGHGGVGPDPAAADRGQPDLQRGEVHAARRHPGGLARTPRRPAHRDLGHRRGHRAGAPARDLPRVLQGADPRRHRGRLRPGPVHRGRLTTSWATR